MVKNQSEQQKKVNEVIAFVKKSGGIEYAKEVMNTYYREALDILACFEPSDYRDSLYELVKYTIEREN